MNAKEGSHDNSAFKYNNNYNVALPSITVKPLTEDMKKVHVSHVPPFFHKKCVDMFNFSHLVSSLIRK